MRTNGGARDVRRWSLALGVVGALTALGGFGHAQRDVTPDGGTPAEDTPIPTSRRGAARPAGPRVLPPVANRDDVPPLAVLESALATMRQEPMEVGRPALEHAALSLAAARTAETRARRGAAETDGARAGAAPGGGQDAREDAAASAASLQARRIAYAALRLAAAQRAREQARLLRDEAARARASAEAGQRLATQALARARANAAAQRGEEAQAGAPGPDRAQPDGAAAGRVEPDAPTPDPAGEAMAPDAPATPDVDATTGSDAPEQRAPVEPAAR